MKWCKKISNMSLSSLFVWPNCYCSETGLHSFYYSSSWALHCCMVFTFLYLMVFCTEEVSVLLGCQYERHKQSKLMKNRNSRKSVRYLMSLLILGNCCRQHQARNFMLVMACWSCLWWGSTASLFFTSLYSIPSKQIYESFYLDNTKHARRYAKVHQERYARRYLHRNMLLQAVCKSSIVTVSTSY